MMFTPNTTLTRDILQRFADRHHERTGQKWYLENPPPNFIKDMSIPSFFY